jgi:hypothetical protein
VAGWPLARPSYYWKRAARMFAVGECAAANIKRCAAAVGEGSIAIAFFTQVLPSVEDLHAGSTMSHIDAIRGVKQPPRHVCEESVKIGARWVICAPARVRGTHCCDDSPNRHATKQNHARAAIGDRVGPSPANGGCTASRTTRSSEY